MKNITLRLLSFIFVISCCSLAFTSCGSDDDDTPSGGDLQEELLGAWKATQMTVSVMGQTVTFDEDDFDDLKGEAGVAGFYDTYLNFSMDYVVAATGGRYTYNIKGNKINFPDWYGDIWGTVKLSGSSMTITYDKMPVTEDGSITAKCVIHYTRTARSSARSTEKFETVSGILNAVNFTK